MRLSSFTLAGVAKTTLGLFGLGPYAAWPAAVGVVGIRENRQYLPLVERAKVQHFALSSAAISPAWVVAHMGDVGCGQPGTMVLGAHTGSLTEGNLFGRLPQARVGDMVWLLSRRPQLYRYSVTGLYVLPRADWMQGGYDRRNPWSPIKRNDVVVPALRMLTCLGGTAYAVVEAE